MSLLLAITNGDRLIAGLTALLLCLLALIIWIFPIILLGRFWRHMTRPRRQRGMRVMIVIMFLLTAALLIGVPHTSYDIMDDPASANAADGDEIVVESRCVGITSWYVRREEMRLIRPTTGVAVAPMHIETAEVNLIGMLALVPALAAMWLLARWLWHEMPAFYRRPAGRCDVCDYDLRGNASAVCPECGETVA